MVTDGEIPQPDKSILDTIKAMHDNRYRGGGAVHPHSVVLPAGFGLGVMYNNIAAVRYDMIWPL